MSEAARPEIVLVPGPLSRQALCGSVDGVYDVLAVPIAPAQRDDGEVQPRFGTADAGVAYGIDLFELAEREGVKGGAGEVHVVSLPRLTGAAAPWDGLSNRLALVGVGDESPTAMRRAGAVLARIGTGRQRMLTTLAGQGDANAVRALVEGVLLASYRPPFTGLGTGPAPALGRLTILGEVDESAVADARIAARATLLARLLTATPSNVKNPQSLADRMVELAAGIDGVTVSVHDEHWLERTGLAGIAAVGRGSATPPRLVTVAYAPERTRGPQVVLVGKGITYDTGGISIKPREAMVPMKTDMAGAAAAFAAVLAAAEAKLPVRVTAVLPLAENAFGGASYRPGDVIRMVDGTSVEIRNTDAEGRIVLADAMAWVRLTLAPDVLVDVATLTGAASLGLGKRHGALYSNDPDLSTALVAAGDRTGEALWPMPLVEEYRAALDSAVADLSHIATDTRVSGGSITAALFLEHFAGDTPWAHLDIAGPARAAKTEHEVTEGPSGFGARLLFRWLASRS